jgi:hypothetical protein
MLETINNAIESLKENKILIFLTFLPFIILLILLYAFNIKLLDVSSISLTAFVPPLMGTETFLNSIKIDEWSDLIENKEWKDFGMQIFFLGVVIYYFIIYSFYSKSKLGGKFAIIQALLLALLFIFLFNYLSKLKIVVITLLALLLVFVIPAGSSGFGIFESFQESFRIVKENLLEVFSLLFLSVGIFVVTGLFSQELIFIILEFFNFSWKQEAIASYILITFVDAVIIAFQICLFTSYFSAKKKLQK